MLGKTKEAHNRRVAFLQALAKKDSLSFHDVKPLGDLSSADIKYLCKQSFIWFRDGQVTANTSNLETYLRGYNDAIQVMGER